MAREVQKRGSAMKAPAIDLAPLYDMADKAGIDHKRAEELFNTALISEQQYHPTLDQTAQAERAMRRARIAFKREAGGPGSSQGRLVEIVFLGIGGLIDTAAKARDEAAKLFAANPKKAVAAGVTDEEGTPLDTRAKWASGAANPGFGKPLPAFNYIRPAFLLIKPLKDDDHDEEGDVFAARTMLDCNKAGEEPPILFHVYEAKVTSEKDDGSVNLSRAHGFHDMEKDVPAEELLSSDALADYRTTAAEIPAYIDTHGDRSVCILEGDVVYMDLDPDEGMSRSMYVDDESDEQNQYGTRCWLPDWYKPDFSVDSRAYVIGQPRWGERYGASIQAMGVHAIEEFKIPAPDIEAVPEQTVPKSREQRHAVKASTKKEEFTSAQYSALRMIVRRLVAKDKRGADYEAVRQAVRQDGAFKWGEKDDRFDELLSAAMDAGFVFEPTLGFIALTDGKPDEDEGSDEDDGNAEKAAPKPEGKKAGW